MRLLHVVASLNPTHGGVSKIALELSAALRRAGHEVSLFSTAEEGDETTFEWPEGLDIRLFPVSLYKKWCFSSQLAKALREQLTHTDVAHLHSTWDYPILCAGWFAQRAGVPYVPLSTNFHPEFAGEFQ